MLVLRNTFVLFSLKAKKTIGGNVYVSVCRKSIIVGMIFQMIRAVSLITLIPIIQLVLLHVVSIQVTLEYLLINFQSIRLMGIKG